MKHDTLTASIKGHIDSFTREKNTFYIEGWILDTGQKEIKEIRLVPSCDDDLYPVSYSPSPTIILKDFIKRPDVEKYYESHKVYGFQYSFEVEKEFDTLLINLTYLDSDKTFPIMEFKNSFIRRGIPPISVNNIHPSIMAVDDFYSDPDAVREYALSLEFNQHKQYHKGRRTEVKTFFEGTQEFLEDALKKKITSWDNQPHNGVFQYCIAEDQLVYHTDSQTYAAVVFLTPGAPAEAGTSFFKHKTNGLRRKPTEKECKKFGKSVDELMWDMFKGNFYDKTPWETVDVIGNVYNRMALWDAQLVHAASEYFGDQKESGRLFHMFFFDAR